MPEDILAPLQPLKDIKTSMDTTLESAVESLGGAVSQGAPPVPQIPGLPGLEESPLGMLPDPTQIMAGLPPLPGLPGKRTEEYKIENGNQSESPPVQKEDTSVRFETSY